jgi:hypothetical protein
VTNPFADVLWCAMPKEKKLRRKVSRVMIGTTVLTFVTLVIGYRLLF